ncbi:protein NUCLEAR FUSION DEFECTIVE 4-like [Arachis ipaensis]|uniref:protein NUCLEAR FUSION DEFECTIVE 4-like n=1 Tax=Arachis ipaensis TaxID=130454 RepID=UPI0007AFA7F5|nr:protein NUCLEAR FUSION DEFECTIVE 4-like [Arachis ipaensis]XP_025685301.1 protein NUCLEAR FUSION DEFECTIVE 4-like [Arachis hypogaea]
MLLEVPATSILSGTLSTSASNTTASTRSPPSTLSPTKPSPLPSSTTSSISCKRMLEEEQCGDAVLGRLDFWLYYVTYICGGTIGLVYSNNLGQIAEPVGTSCDTSTLVIVYASFSFFGRLLSALPDYIGSKLYFARTGWLCIALIPSPIAFTFMALSQTPLALPIDTALIGVSSGFKSGMEIVYRSKGYEIVCNAIRDTSNLLQVQIVGYNYA